MSITYTPTTNFGAKDSLPANDPAKVIKGAEFTTEYTAIQSAFALAAPSASPTITGTATFDDVSITNGLTVDGTTLVVDDTNNRVGIGTATPSAALDLFEGADERLKFTTIGSNAGIISTNAADSAYQPLEIQASTLALTQGNVGIGTAAPANELHIGDGSTSPNANIQGSVVGTLLFSDSGNTAQGRVRYVYGSGMQLWTEGSERMRIDSSGNVGIGTSSPGVSLDVNGGSNTQIRLTASDSLGASMINFGDQSNVAVGRIVYSHVNDAFSFKTNNVNDRMVIDSSGNVGIGTDAPDRQLYVKDTGSRNTAAKFETTVAGAYASFADVNSTPGQLAVRFGALGDDAIIYAGNTERMRVNSSGNVGIGTVTPSTLLDVNKVVSAGIATVLELSNGGSGDGTQAELQFTAANGRYGAIQSGADSGAVMRFESGTTTDGRFEFKGATGTEFMRIDPSGNVGIGTSAPTADLDVRKVTEATLAVKNTAGQGAEISGSASGAEFGSPNSIPVIFNTAGTERMRIDSSGNVLVGKTASNTASDGCEARPEGLLTATRTNNVCLSLRRSAGTGDVAQFYRDSTLAGSISVSGSTTTYNTSSDERLKENIVDAPAGNIDALQVRSFDWKADGEHQTYGFVAQELDLVAPYAVTKGDTEEDMWAVDYSKLVPMLVKEIQDLKAEVEALKNA